MPPKETDHLLSSSPMGTDDDDEQRRPFDRTLQIKVTSFDDDNVQDSGSTKRRTNLQARTFPAPACARVAGATAVTVAVTLAGLFLFAHRHSVLSTRLDTSSHLHMRSNSSKGTSASSNSGNTRTARTGAYFLTEVHQGESFSNFYDFYEGADSLGSAGYNTYTSKERAQALGLINVTTTSAENADADAVFTMTSLPTEKGPRESIRLEGKTRFDEGGLFILNVDHIPSGCGQWPAFWLTDEDAWPNHGEIDILEGVNYQAHAKTALHTSDQCRMYAHVPQYKMTGTWDRATGIPDTYTGTMDFATSVPADNCWVMAPHQWANQGCVITADQNDTLGDGLNAQDGGIFALQWDPEYQFIRSWVFPKARGIPDNLQQSMDSSSSTTAAVSPDPDTWGLPYAYFAIGEGTGCAANHFSNMRIVFNTAFCGTVAGNRFFTDCPMQAAQFNISNDPVQSCNAWIASNPAELNEAYWSIRGVYVYERAWETKEVVVSNTTKV